MKRVEALDELKVNVDFEKLSTAFARWRRSLGSSTMWLQIPASVGQHVRTVPPNDALWFDLARTASLWAPSDCVLLLVFRFNMPCTRDCVPDLPGKHVQRMPARLLATAFSECFAGGLIAV